MSVASWCCTCVHVVLCVSFCTRHFVVVPLNLTYLHCLQHSLFEHLFNLYYNVNSLKLMPNVIFYSSIRYIMIIICMALPDVCVSNNMQYFSKKYSC